MLTKLSCLNNNNYNTFNGNRLDTINTTNVSNCNLGCFPYTVPELGLLSTYKIQTSP